MINRSSLFVRSYLTSVYSRRTLFGRDKSNEKAKEDFDEGLAQQSSVPLPSIAELASYKTKKYVDRLVTCRPYDPPSNIEETFVRLTNETLDNDNIDRKQWASMRLDDPLKKYRLLTRCMNEYSHTIPNMTLNDLQTLEDVFQYFSTPVRDTNALEDLQRSDELPQNVHIQLDAVRFTPETSGFFSDLDAFPQRSTKIVDLWYKKKYASFPKNEEDPFKDNIY